MINDQISTSGEFTAFLAMLGLIVGSFISTVSLRLPKGEPIIFDRSHCDTCGNRLRPWQLVPLVGWIAQGGRCHYCQARISPVYIVTELGAAAVCLWTIGLVTPALWIPSILLGWLLLAVAVMDWRYLVLNDFLLVPLFGLGVVVNSIYWPANLFAHICGGAAGATALYGINAVYRLTRHRDGIGFGDVKLAGIAGLWLGWRALPSLFVIASTLALVVLLIQRGFGIEITWAGKVAFGTYLCLAIWIVWLYGPIAWG